MNLLCFIAVDLQRNRGLLPWHDGLDLKCAALYVLFGRLKALVYGGSGTFVQ